VSVTAETLLNDAPEARREVVRIAAWMHDFVVVPKSDPRRSQASQLSAEASLAFLETLPGADPTLGGWLTGELREAIGHAIEAHSYSAGIEPKTLEAAIVQDADRLDGVGAIGIARCFWVGGALGRPLYCADDPWARAGRTWDDGAFTLDHFYVKLFRTVESLRTDSGRREGARRLATMQAFLDELERELGRELGTSRNP